MKQGLNKYWKWLLSLLLGVAVFLFWRLSYPFALNYQEQFQMFLFDETYLCGRLSEPGGAARYVSEFLVQFYNNVTLGAAVIALLLVLMQALTWLLLRKEGQDDGSCVPGIKFLLSFLPPLLTWYMMGDENLLLAFPVAIIAIEALMLLYRSLSAKGLPWRLAAIVLLLPVAYWLTGPVVMVLAVYIAYQPKPERFADYGIGAGAITYVLFCIVGSGLFLPYTLSQIFCGLGYYRYVEAVMLAMALLVVLVALLPLLVRFLPAFGKRQKVVSLSLAVLLVVVAAVMIPRNFDKKTYELIEYDYLVRAQQWEKIIAKAEKQQPDLPMSVCSTNLALAMTGQLTERAFDFYQRGSEGLLPKFERNYTTTLVTGEAYYHLGLVNMAQTFAFEAMEAIPNYNKSVRCIRRLAETNIVNGEYNIARKYLDMLKKTMFYSKWATRTEALLNDEKQVNAHPVYGKLRGMLIKDDLLFSERELDKICGQLVTANKNNMMAVQYLLMYPVLDRDINRFMNYMMYVSEQHPGYSPRICQETVTFAYASRRQQPPRGTVPDAMLQQYNQFLQTYQHGGPLEMFSHTAWYYLVKQ